MIKKALLMFGFLFGSIYGYPSCVPELNPALKIIYRFPEGKDLIKAVESEGHIQIYSAPFGGPSTAMWKGDERAIVVNSSYQRTLGQTIRSIVFELHNALTNKHFCQIDHSARMRQLTRNEYVVAIERMEHENALMARKLLEKGIAQGVFPEDAYWPISHDFDYHFRIQQQCGHARGVAFAYDYLTSTYYAGNERENR